MTDPIARLRQLDPELAAQLERLRPSAAIEAELRAEREAENARRRAAELRALYELVRDARDGIFGREIAQRTREILEQGRSEAYLRRIERVVKLERLAAKRRRRAA